MRKMLTLESLEGLMVEIARCAPQGATYRVFLIGGGTAVLIGWRESTIDIDLYSDQELVFRDVQEIKERLKVNIEFVRPEHFVPPLAGTEDRHVFIQTIGRVSFFHYDPYAQLFSKVVRGFRRDLADAQNFVSSGMVELTVLQKLVQQISDVDYARYPALTREAVETVIEAFVMET